MRTFVRAALFIVSMLAAGAPFAAAMGPWRVPGACGANISLYDVYQSSGVINVIDMVLMPK